ncbi:collagen alpha-1(II) chain-like [Pan troglodytes]|uniref:collagen alpha-1(II) chain-like n=1 Tax=Pan troglodytes TaxID=9598 RepID=UPI0030134553
MPHHTPTAQVPASPIGQWQQQNRGPLGTSGALALRCGGGPWPGPGQLPALGWLQVPSGPSPAGAKRRAGRTFHTSSSECVSVARQRPLGPGALGSRGLWARCTRARAGGASSQAEGAAGPRSPPPPPGLGRKRGLRGEGLPLPAKAQGSRPRAAPVRAAADPRPPLPSPGRDEPCSGSAATPRAAGRGRSPRRSARCASFTRTHGAPCQARRPGLRGRLLRRLPPPGPRAASPGLPASCDFPDGAMLFFQDNRGSSPPSDLSRRPPPEIARRFPPCRYQTVTPLATDAENQTLTIWRGTTTTQKNTRFSVRGLFASASSWRIEVLYF